ncbi:acetylxylan esterase [Streptosporangium vulgare]|uniref:Acetylxylan esterase n=1 Tax=Streptosporangium vulgare TaxID=46190 RepID=A0ABV5THY6_9ACTN
MLTDLDEAGLLDYRSAVVDPEDFDAFWTAQLQRAAEHPIDVRATAVDSLLETIDVFDVRFAGHGGHPIRGWLYLPKHRTTPIPGVVQYQGYGGGRGHHLESLLWSSAGYAHLMMDSRGQGSGYRRGATADPVGPSGPTIPGQMTNGIEDPAGHYYTRLYVDAVRAVDALRSFSTVDVTRIAVVGGSQGGALALAAAALRDDVAAVVAHVPFLSDIRRASRITDAMPYKEIGRYLATHRDATERVFATLAYFDGVSLARRITAPTWLSAALMDSTCPPSTVYGVYHELAGEREIRLWEFNGHEGGGPDDDERALRALRAVFDRTNGIGRSKG